MKSLLIAIALLLVAPVSASADDFNPDGWTLLGSKKVKPGKKVNLSVEGTGFYDELTFVVEGVDLQVNSLTVSPESGDKTKVDESHAFADTARSWTVSVTKSSGFNLKLTTSGKTKRAGKLYVYGRDSARAVLAPRLVQQGAIPAPNQGASAASLVPVRYNVSSPEPIVDTSWSPEGWTLLGEDDVDLIDDVVEIKKKKSTWDAIALVTDGDDVTVESVELSLGGKKAKTQREDIEKDFTGGDHVRVIEIAGGRRAVSKVRLQYRKHRVDASTRVLIYAR